MPLNSIDIFPWDDNFNTGVPKIDEQHRRLVQMLNRLATALAYGTGAELLNRTFDEMTDYAVYHFETEEAIWREYLADDPAEVAHRAIHRAFVEKAVGLKASLGARALSEVAEDTLGFLTHWLASHILESDRYLSYVVHARREGLPLEAAKRRAKEDMGGATRALIDIILSVYSSFSTNTLRLMRELSEHRQAKNELSGARQALQESEVNFRSFFDTIDDFLFVLDAQGLIVRVNGVVIERLGYPEADLIGKSVLVVHPADRHEEAQRIIGEVLSGKEDACPVPLQASDGTLIPVETRVVAGQWNGAPALFGVSRDISGQIRIRQQLQAESENRRQLLAEASEREFFWKESQQVGLLGGWRADPIHNTVMWTPGVYEIVEMPVDYQPDLETGLDFYLPESRARVTENLQRALTTGEPFRIQVQVRGAKTGAVKWTELRGHPHHSADGKIDYLIGTLQDITERKQQEAKYQSLFENASDGIFLLDESGFIDCNAKGAALYGLPREQILGRHPIDFAQERQPDGRLSSEVADEAILKAMTGEPQRFEWLISPDGGRTILVDITLNRIDLGGKAHIQAIVRDITERKRSETALRESEQRFDLAMRAANDGLWDWNLQTNVVYFSPRWKSMLGYRDDELQSSFARWEQLVDGEGRVRTMALIQDCIAGRSEGFSTEFRMLHKQGHWVDVLSRATLIRNESGQAVRMVGTHVDISALKRAELAQRESASRLRAMIEALPIPVALNDAQGAITYLNPAFVSTFGYTPTDIPTLAQWWPQAYPDAAYRQWVGDTWSARVEQARRSGAGFDPMEIKVRAKDGATRVVLASAASLQADYQGEHMVVLFDITEQIQAETALQNSNKLLQAVIEHLPMRVFWKDKDLNYLGCNPAFARDAGCATAADMVGRDDYQMGWAHEADLYRDDDRQVIDSGMARINFEEPQTTPDGKQIWLRTSKVPLKNAQGELFGVLGMYDDITDRKQAEQELEAHRHHLEELVAERTAALREREQRLAETQQIAHLGSWEFDLASGQLSWSDETFRIAGLPVRDVAPSLEEYRASVHPDDLPALDACIERAIQQQLPYELELRHRRPDGSYNTTHTRGQPVIESGQVVRLVGSVLDIAERKQAERRNQQLLAILDKSPDFISTATMDGEIRYLNPAGFRLVGMPEDTDLRQKHIPDFHPEWALRKVADEGIPATLRQGSWQGEIALLHRDGHEIPGWQTILKHKDELGQPAYLSTIVRDITQQKADEQALIDAKQAAEAANVAKSAFLANMSHEIRTPLNAIAGMAHLIRRAGLTEKQVEQMGKLEAASEHLLSIINAILELSKIEAGKFALDETEVSVHTVFSNVVSMLQARAQAKQLRLSTEISALPPHLVGDPTRLQQALLNFAGNAVKFTERGQVALRVECLEESADSALLRFEVQDTGIGIAPEALPRLFSAFEQADNTMTRKYGGTGLGLAIARKFAQLMDGDAGARSTLGVGSTFWLTARLKKSGAPRPSAESERSQMAEEILRREYQGARILLAEDEPVNREITQIMLTDVGLVVDAAEDGREALQLASKNEYALVYMDMQMPEMDGLEATRRIRALQAYGQTPIIAMTANAFAEDKVRCLDAGMNDFITKPVNPDQFYVVTLKYLSASRRDQP